MSNPRVPLLSALVEALEDPHALLTLLLQSEDRQAAIRALEEEYGWDLHQAEIVMDMPLSRVTRGDRAAITEELRCERGQNSAGQS
ncbi:hypothetical protein [uncultured Serinicoccus sp.]|uniref:hypothetical protein n=1 Tax=uncultured Serinicoccus sp. TaxID=735514 RepID=UPI00262B944F|nr:hypothetical protein [uncultured Serinicoccus sp.]